MIATLVILIGLAAVLVLAFPRHDPKCCPECLSEDQETAP
jgi:hypothetical protein